MEQIKIKEDIIVPGTNILLEKGDKITLLNYSSKNQESINIKESTLPAIAKTNSLSLDPRITSIVRKDSVYNTCVSMGLPTKINAMNNVVVSVADMSQAASVLQTIYEQFGIKGSFMVTWEGNGKVYFDPRTPIDTKMQIAYAKTHNMALPSKDPKRLIGY